MKLLNSNIFTNIKFFLRRTLSMVTLILAIHGHSEAFAQPEPLCDSVTIREIHKNYRSQVKRSRKEFKAIGPEKSRYNRKLYRTLVKGEKERFKEERNSLLVQAIERDYLNNLTSYRSSWSNFIPSYSKIQLAGGIGTVSAGPG